MPALPPSAEQTIVSDDEPLEHPLRREAEADLARIVRALEALTGLKSQWRGIVRVEEAGYPTPDKSIGPAS